MSSTQKRTQSYIIPCLFQRHPQGPTMQSLASHIRRRSCTLMLIVHRYSDYRLQPAPYVLEHWTEHWLVKINVEKTTNIVFNLQRNKRKQNPDLFDMERFYRWIFNFILYKFYKEIVMSFDNITDNSSTFDYKCKGPGFSTRDWQGVFTSFLATTIYWYFIFLQQPGII
jgi:hypothetical protein